MLNDFQFFSQIKNSRTGNERMLYRIPSTGFAPSVYMNRNRNEDVDINI